MAEAPDTFFACSAEDHEPNGYWKIGESRRLPDLMAVAETMRRREWPVERALPMMVMSGRHAADWLEYPFGPIVSDRTKLLLASFLPASTKVVRTLIYDAKDRNVVRDQYWFLQPDVGAGPVDESGPGYHRLFDGSHKHDPLGLIQFGLHFDHASWDGSPVFALPRGPACIVTRPVVDALQKAKISNLRIEDVLIYRRWLRDLQQVARNYRKGPSLN